MREACDLTTETSTGTSSARPRREHLADIDRAKGLGIFLVVLGHLVTGRPPEGADWYMTLRAAIYAFHMPFFIYLSGYMFYYTASDQIPSSGRPSFFLKRAERLLIPFFAFGVFIVIGKHVAANFIHVDNYSNSIFADIVNLFWDTRASAAKSVWYIFVLFEYTVVLVIVHAIVSNRVLLLLISIPLSVLPVLPILYADRFFLYLPFFLFAGLAVQRRERWTAFVDRYLWINLIIFAAAIIVTRVIANYNLSILLCGFLSIPVLHGFCRRKISEVGGVLAILGGFSFVIYLLNTVAIGLAKGVLLFFVPWDGSGFFLLFPLLLAAGILGPVVAKALIFRRVPYLDRLTT